MLINTSLHKDIEEYLSSYPELDSRQHLIRLQEIAVHAGNMDTRHPSLIELRTKRRGRSNLNLRPLDMKIETGKEKRYLKREVILSKNFSANVRDTVSTDICNGKGDVLQWKKEKK